MARKVDKKFVAILGACLAVGGVGAVVVTHYWHRRHQDPKALEAAAIKLESAGDIPGAVDMYESAANAAAVARSADADRLYVKLSELSDSYASKAKNLDESLRYAQKAYAALLRAQMANPRSVPVNLRAMKYSYEEAQIVRSLQAWTSLEERADKFITIEPKCPEEPFMYRAEARLRLIQLKSPVTMKDTPDSRFKDIEADVKKALDLDPTSGKAEQLRGELMGTQATIFALRGNMKQSKDMFEAMQKEMREFLDKHPNDPQVVRFYAPQVAIGWNGKGDPALSVAGNVKESIRLAQAAFDAHPDNEDLAEVLGALYSTSDGSHQVEPDKTEGVFKALIAAKPDSAAGYFRLASFYTGVQKYPEAVTTFKACRAHIKQASGIEAVKNQQWELESLFRLCQIHQDMAEMSGATLTASNPDLKEAMGYADELRRSGKFSKGMLDFVEGRYQLLIHKLPEAEQALRSAESNLRDNPGVRNYLWQTMMLLAKANEIQRPPQYGAALDYYDKALALQPNAIRVIINRAAVLNELGRFQETELLMKQLLAPENKLPKAVADAAKQLLETAQTRQETPNLTRQLIYSRIQFANSKLYAGDNEGALAAANWVSDQNPGNVGAAIVAAQAYAGMGKQDEGVKVVDAALVKASQDRDLLQLKEILSKPLRGNSLEIQEQIINATPDEYIRQIRLAMLYRMRNLPDKSLAAYQAARATLGDADTLESRQKWNEVIQQGFDAAFSYASVATDDASRKKYQDFAQSYVQWAEQHAVDGVGGKLFRGRLELLKKNEAAGVKLLEQAAGQRPDYEPILSALGMAYLDQNRTDAALEQFRQALKLRPDNMLVTSYTIGLLAKKGDPASWQEARDLLQQGLQIAPTDPNLARYADMIGDLSAAVKHREQIEKSNPDDANNIRRLTLLYIRASEDAKGKKDLPGAQDYLNKAEARMKPMVARDPKNLDDVALLAKIYAIPPAMSKDPNDNLEQLHGNRVLEGMKLFEPAMADEKLKYDALMTRGVFLQSPDAKQVTFNSADGAHPVSGMELAASSFMDAAKLEAEGHDDAQRHLADLYFDNNKNEEAEKIYQKIYDKTAPGMPRMLVLRRLAEVLLREQKWEAADKLIQEEILAKTPDDPQGLVLKAASLIERDRSKDAIVVLSQVLAKNANYADALYYRAMAQFKLGVDYDKVINDLLVAKKSAPENVNARMLLAATYGKTRKFAEAANEYSEVLKTNQKNLQLRLEYMDYLLNMVKVVRLIPEGASDSFANDVKAVRPKETFNDLLADSRAVFPGYLIWYIKGADYYTAIGNIPEAQSWYEIIYKNTQKRIDAAQHELESVPQAQQNSPEFQKFREAYTAEINSYQDASLGYLKSLLLTKKPKDCEDVIAIATKAMAVPYMQNLVDYHEFYLCRAEAYFVLNKRDEGQADIDQALNYAAQRVKKSDTGTYNYGPFMAIMAQVVEFTPPDLLAARLKVRLNADPNDTLSAVGLTHVLMMMNKPDDAVKLVASLKVPPENKALQALVLKETGMAYYAAKDYPNAVKAFSDQIALVPEDIDSLNNLAFILADNLHRPKDAMPLIEKALAVLNASGNPTVIAQNAANLYDTYGWIKSLNGDQAGAITDLRKSIQSTPQPTTYYHLAQALVKAQQLPEARLTVDQGLKLAVATNDSAKSGLEQLQKELATK